ncbi:hypothetical protein CBR_g68669 [Chara braunii]|uniref:Uncharacterized protein n=1 Tax=Chara braunii TaxID=69332 RepID=A0A388MFZ8_CHABU|nr:hypothetical protein CBR_g68669 [Chara braunii]|eukprot:GBG93405.1 hypothetical protein CBR_g68669 [Chara braunii]
MPDADGMERGPAATLEDFVKALEKRELARVQVPKIDIFHFEGERVSKWLELLEQITAEVSEADKFKYLPRYIWREIRPEIMKVAAGAGGDWAEFKAEMQRRIKRGDGLLTKTDLEMLHRDELSTVEAFATAFEKMAKKVPGLAEEEQCATFLGHFKNWEASLLTKKAAPGKKLIWAAIKKGVMNEELDQVDIFQMRQARKKRKTLDATTSDERDFKKMVEDAVTQLEATKEARRKTMAAPQTQGKAKKAVVQEEEEEEEEEEPEPQKLTKAQREARNLATGRQGSGRGHVPQAVAMLPPERLPRNYCTPTRQAEERRSMERKRKEPEAEGRRTFERGTSSRSQEGERRREHISHKTEKRGEKPSERAHGRRELEAPEALPQSTQRQEDQPMTEAGPEGPHESPRQEMDEDQAAKELEKQERAAREQEIRAEIRGKNLEELHKRMERGERPVNLKDRKGKSTQQTSFQAKEAAWEKRIKELGTKLEQRAPTTLVDWTEVQGFEMKRLPAEDTFRSQKVEEKADLQEGEDVPLLDKEMLQPEEVSAKEGAKGLKEALGSWATGSGSEVRASGPVIQEGDRAACPTPSETPQQEATSEVTTFPPSVPSLEEEKTMQKKTGKCFYCKRGKHRADDCLKSLKDEAAGLVTRELSGKWIDKNGLQAHKVRAQLYRQLQMVMSDQE